MFLLQKKTAVYCVASLMTPRLNTPAEPPEDSILGGRSAENLFLLSTLNSVSRPTCFFCFFFQRRRWLNTTVLFSRIWRRGRRDAPTSAGEDGSAACRKEALSWQLLAAASPLCVCLGSVSLRHILNPGPPASRQNNVYNKNAFVIERWQNKPGSHRPWNSKSATIITIIFGLMDNCIQWRYVIYICIVYTHRYPLHIYTVYVRHNML